MSSPFRWPRFTSRRRTPLLLLSGGSCSADLTVKTAPSGETMLADHGHGAWIRRKKSASVDFLAVTGPRRALLKDSVLNPYFSVPYGDMMMAGCWGLVRAAAQAVPTWAEAVENALGTGSLQRQ